MTSPPDRMMHCYTPPDRHSLYWNPVANGKQVHSEKPVFWDEARRFLLCRAQVVLPGAERERILFLTDLHLSRANCGEYEELGRLVNEAEADWIVFGGDLVNFMDAVDPAIKWLSSLKARQGKIAVLGNRESPIQWLDHGFWRRTYAKADFRCLINEVWDSGNGIVVNGVDDFRFGSPEWRQVAAWKESGRPVLTVSHNPDAVAEANPETFIGHLALCGHTHGGQFVLPFWGPLYTSSGYGRQFVHGWNRRQDGTLMLTSTGIGESGFGFLHRRICCPREVAFLTLLPTSTC